MQESEMTLKIYETMKEHENEHEHGEESESNKKISKLPCHVKWDGQRNCCMKQANK